MKRSTAIFLMVVMSALTINKVVYTHVHVLPDGSMVTHAHPFSKNSDSSPKNSHRHSSLELIFFQNLELMFIMVSAAFALKSLAGKSEKIWLIRSKPIITPVTLRPGRAPPHCI